MQNINPSIFNETLARITKSPTLSAGVLEDAVKMIAEEGSKALNTHRVGVWKLSEDANILKSVIYYDSSTGEHSVHEDFDLANRPAYFDLLNSERLIVVNDTSIPNPLSNYTDGTNMCAVLDAPIRIGGELAGLVCIEQDRCEEFPVKRDWTVEEQKFVSSLADFVIIAIESAKRHSWMRRTEDMMNNLPGMIFQCRNDPEFSTVYVSEGCKDLTGYTPEEYMGKKVFISMVHPDDVEPLLKRCEETLSKGLPMEATYRIITKDGTEKWVCEHSRVIETHPDGTPYLLEGFFTDITESHQLEKTEKERERVTTMLNATPLLCNVWDKNYRIIDCNEEVAKVFGLSKEEYMGKFFEFAPEFQPNGQRTDEHAREMIDLAFREGKCVFEVVVKTSDGTLIPMEVTHTRVAYGDDEVIVSYGRDLRRQKQMMSDVAYRDYLLQSVNQAAALLLSIDDSEDIESPIMESMEIVCRAVSADRVSIWRNEIRDDDLYHICEYTWNIEDENQTSQISTGQIIHSDKDRMDWRNRFMRGECIGGPVSKMLPKDRKFLSPFGMQSVIIIPLFVQGQFWGLFSIANRELERDFTEDEISILRSVSLMMASAINRHSLIEKISAATERTMLMLDTSPLCAQIWDRNLNTIDCNEAGVKLYGFKDKQEYRERFLECCSPEYQPDGQRSDEKAVALVGKAFDEGYCVFDWIHQKPDGTPIPAEVTLVRAKYADEDVVLGYTRDLREYNKMMAEIENRDNMLRSVNQAAALLLAADSNEDIEPSIMESLGIVCRAVGATRVSIWRNEIIDGYLNHICTYSWINQLGDRVIQNPIGFKISRERYGPNWENKFARGECVSGPLSRMSQGEQDALSPLGTKSIAIIPLFVREQFWGLFSVSYYDQERNFSEDEISIFRSVSLMMASTIHRHSLIEDVAEAQERTNVLFDTTPLGCSLWDEEFNQTNPNMEMVHLFGLKDKQEYLDRFFELSPEHQPDGTCSKEFALENIKKAFRDGYCQFEHWHQKPDGTPIPTEVSLIRISTNEGYIVAGYIRDLREHKKMLAEIRKADEHVQLMFDATPLCCQLLDKNYKTIACNEEAVKLARVKDKQEFIELFDSHKLWPEYQPDGTRSIDRARINNEMVLQGGDGFRHVFDWTLSLPDGTLLPTEVTLRRIKYGDDDVFAVYKRDMSEHNRMMAEIDSQNNLLATMNHVSTILLDPDIDSFESILIRAMGVMAEAVDTDRVCIWKNHIKDGRLYCTEVYEWRGNDITPHIGSSTSIDVSYDDTLPGWEEALSQGKCVKSIVSAMSQEEQAQLSTQGILSLFVTPIFVHNTFWGFVGFDNFHNERMFTENEELILRAASRMIANALIRNEMTHEIRTTATRLENVFTHYPGMIWCVDRDGTISLFDGLRSRNLGFLPADVVGKKVKDAPQNLAHSEVVDYVEKTFDGEAQDWVIKTDRAIYHMHTTPIHGDDGSVASVVGSADDITEIAHLQEHLAIAVEETNAANAKMDRTLRTMESIMNNIDMFIYVNDPVTGKIFFINDKMKQAFGIEGDDGIGRHCYELFRGADAICEFCPCHQLDREPNKTIVWEEYDANLQRHIHHFDCYINWPTGDVVHLQYAYDITELVVARESAKQSDHAKSDFLAKMSHEIRTPMNAIIGMTELALGEDISNTARNHITTVKQAGVSLLSIINDILDFSKIESGGMQIVPANYLLSSLLNDVISIIRMRAIDSQIRFTVYLDSKLPNALFGDEIRIRQVLINLLGNAVKYTDKGYVSLTVYGEMPDESTLNLTMEIKDSGKGIKEKDMEKLFQNFSQIDAESNRGIEGVGLGLAISLGIVKAMDGDIKVESEYGKGSSFTVTMPQKITHIERLAVVENFAEKSSLIYERREVYADSIVYAINNLDIKYELVTNDEAFCEMLRNRSFSHIFIPHMLFEKNRDAIFQFSGDAQIVLLAEFGESTPIGNWRVISMPMYAISVANIFNGTSDSFSYHTSEEQVMKFTAPDARVLVVDDINTNLKVANGLLLPYQMEIDLCNSGMAAIEAVQSKNYDIVFMDHRMPGMDGVETTERIRVLENEPYYKNLPIVALTANAVAGMQEMFLQSGFNDFLSKPIDTVKLNKILERWIPKEKQINTSTGSGVIKRKMVNTDSSSTVAVKIEGLDTNKGVRLSGGTLEYYYETLATFYEDGLERVHDIKKCLDSGDLSLYTTYVHALKGASANIGADQFSKAAYDLELAGQRRDLAFIESNNEQFLTMLERLLSNINDALPSRGNDDNADAFETEQFKTELVKLKSALSNMDFEAINRTVDSLLASAKTDQVRTTVRNISKHILLFECEAAEELIESLLKAGGSEPVTTK